MIIENDGRNNKKVVTFSDFDAVKNEYFVNDLSGKLFVDRDDDYLIFTRTNDAEEIMIHSFCKNLALGPLYRLIDFEYYPIRLADDNETIVINNQ